MIVVCCEPTLRTLATTYLFLSALGIVIMLAEAETLSLGPARHQTNICQISTTVETIAA